MDTSKEYIEMCEKAHEIQMLRKNRKGEIKLLEFDFYVDSIEDQLDCYNVSTPNSYRDSCIWLPRQDQLQEILYNEKYFLVHSIQLIIKNFYDFLIRREYFIYKEYKSLEYFWLIFVMEGKFNKTWNIEVRNWEV